MFNFLFGFAAAFVLATFYPPAVTIGNTLAKAGWAKVKALFAKSDDSDNAGA